MFQNQRLRQILRQQQTLETCIAPYDSLIKSSRSAHPLLKIWYCALEAFFQADTRFPAQYLVRPRNIRPSALRISFAALTGFEGYPRGISNQTVDNVSKLQDGGLQRVAQINRLVLVGEQQLDNSFDQVIHITKAARLGAVSINCEWFSF